MGDSAAERVSFAKAGPGVSGYVGMSEPFLAAEH